VKRDKLLTAVVARRADGELLKLVSPDVPTEKQNGAKWKPDASACGPESTLSSRATQRKTFDRCRRAGRLVVLPHLGVAGSG
jgi:hypothetical protein